VTEGTRKPEREVGRRRYRAAAWLAWSLWVVVIALGAIWLNLSDVRMFWYGLTHYLERPESVGDVLTSGVLVLTVPAYATVGALVASLRPKNGVGWMCLALSFGIVLNSWRPTNLALMDLVEFVSNLLWFLIVPPLPVTLMLLIFPDGRLPSLRWWVVVGMALVGPLGALPLFFRPTPPPAWQGRARVGSRSSRCWPRWQPCSSVGTGAAAKSVSRSSCLPTRWP
jgi:hypothetical protein